MSEEVAASGGLVDLFAVDSDDHSTTYAVAYDVASFIDRSFDEALPYQYLREFVVNAIEANAQNIIIEPDWIYVENCVENGLDPVYRFSIWDDGDGMDEKTLMRFHRVFDSTKGNMRGRHANFGMGGKISALPINHAGLVVMSWQNGVGNMLVFHRDQKADQYGLFRQFVEEDDQVFRMEVAPTPAEYDYFYDANGNRQQRINGTLIIFKGMSETDNTYLGPSEYDWKTVETTIRTNALEMNKRFARLNRPDLTVQVYGPAHRDPKLWALSRADASGTATKGHPLYRPSLTKQPRFGQYRLMQGCFTFWDEACSHQGIVDLPDGKAHWWLFDHVDPADFRKKDPFRVQHGLNKAGKLKTQKTGLYDTYQRAWDRHSYTPGPGRLAVLYKGELYNHRPYGSSHHLYNYFGIYDREVRRRMVIIIEPDYSEDSGVWPNAVRSALEYEDRDSLPWASWGAAFAASMPQVVKDILNSGGGQFRDSPDFRDRILNTVKDIGERYGLYTGPRKRNSSKGNTSNRTSRRTNRNRKQTDKTGGRAIPSFAVIDAAKNPDAPRPAFYNIDARKLDVFASYHIFQEAMIHWKDRFDHMPGSEDIIEDTVLEVYTGMLLARVIHILGLKGQDIYDIKAFETMLSEEALVTAVAGFFDAEKLIQAKLNGKLGSHKAKAAAAAK